MKKQTKTEHTHESIIVLRYEIDTIECTFNGTIKCINTHDNLIINENSIIVPYYEIDTIEYTSMERSKTPRRLTRG
jgi:hypothetical protein